MSFSIDNIILVGSILLFVSLIASKTSKLGIPSLLLFLIIGMLAGSDGPGGIYFDNMGIAKLIGVVALNFILFSGGLDTKWNDIKPIIKQGILLSSLGVLCSTLAMGIFISLVTDFSLLEGLLFGAIVSSTDAAAVFSILRSKNIGLKGNLRPLLEFESGSNDPMAYFLMIVFSFMIVNEGTPFTTILVLFLKQMVIGAGAGYLFGLLMHRLLNRIKLDIDGLYSVFLLSMMLLCFSSVDFVGGNGFLAVYISACVLGNKEFIHKKSLIKHFDGQAWLMQIIMFITLGLLVFPKQIIPYIGIGLVISIFLIFVARPLSVYVSLMFFKINNRSKIYISWVGLRGAVPIILAIYPMTMGIEKANVIFNVVFFVSVTSVLIQGTTMTVVARWLNLIVPVNLKKKSALDIELTGKIKTIVIETIVDASYSCVDKSIVDLGLPSSIVISMIERGQNNFIIPEGNTILEACDKLTVMADNISALEEFNACIGKKK